MGAELRAAQAAPPDEVLRCENCRRILVRTPESGVCAASGSGGRAGPGAP